ncbi:MAG: DNA polymerase III subunit epsilon [Parvibaculum sp.]|uniref:DNA polymerase III subunit epsilon n=1 Tax=Parvibaculum sp. TaxID=2024848 RepID=UPI003C7288D0
MRQIVLDTETTGLSPQEGHRLVELGCIEVMNHVPTGNVFHRYINPERDMPEGAFKVHGLSSEFLRDKPKFAEIAEEFLAFIAEDELVIHNAAFDMAFLNYELKLVSRPPIAARRAIDTLTIARQRFPGAQNSLDALCKRFDIDNSGRVKHGALLDAELLAEVYLELMGGRQPTLVLDASAAALSRGVAVAAERRERPVPLASRLTDAERAAHDAFIDTLGGEPLWRNLPS